MIASELISEDIPSLNHHQTGEEALLLMDELKVFHLPVLKNGNFVGLLSENDILDKMNEKETLDILFDHLPRPFVWYNEHIYDVISKIGELKLTVVPILNEQEKYLGSTSIYNIVSLISNFGGIRENGGIIVLEINKIDYSLSHISQIIESHNAKILSSYIFSIPDSNKIELTIKTNETDLERILRTFARYEYVIKSYYQKNIFESDLKNRFDALINFMNV
jgi:CBS domain-containing protein